MIPPDIFGLVQGLLPAGYFQKAFKDTQTLQLDPSNAKKQHYNLLLDPNESSCIKEPFLLAFTLRCFFLVIITVRSSMLDKLMNKQNNTPFLSSK